MEKNAKPRAVGDKPDKASKKLLATMSDDPSTWRLPYADAAATHTRQLLDEAVARVHKPRAFREVLERLPPVAVRAAEQSVDQLDERRQRCFLPVPEQPPVCRGGSTVWKRMER